MGYKFVPLKFPKGNKLPKNRKSTFGILDLFKSQTTDFYLVYLDLKN